MEETKKYIVIGVVILIGLLLIFLSEEKKTYNLNQENNLFLDQNTVDINNISEDNNISQDILDITEDKNLTIYEHVENYLPPLQNNLIDQREQDIISAIDNCDNNFEFRYSLSGILDSDLVNERMYVYYHTGIILKEDYSDKCSALLTHYETRYNFTPQAKDKYIENNGQTSDEQFKELEESVSFSYLENGLISYDCNFDKEFLKQQVRDYDSNSFKVLKTYLDATSKNTLSFKSNGFSSDSRILSEGINCVAIK
jgi:hypothetical protein